MRNGSKRWKLLPLGIAGALALAAAGGALAQSTPGSPDNQSGTPNSGAPDAQATDMPATGMAASAGTMTTNPGIGVGTPGQPGTENGNLGGTGNGTPGDLGSPETQSSPVESPGEATPFPEGSPAAPMTSPVP